MTKFYLQVQPNGVITDAIEYPHEDYIEVELQLPLPVGLTGGWFKLEDGTGRVVEHPELKPKDKDTEISELKHNNLVTMMALTEAYEEIEDVRKKAINALLAISEAYEFYLQLDDRTTTLEDIVLDSPPVEKQK